MKKFAVIFLSSVMVLSLTACGKEEETPNTSPASTQTEVSSETSTEAETEQMESVSESSAELESQETEQTGENASGEHILIAYFTVHETDGVDTVAGASRVVVDGEVLGNNQYIAQLIQQEVGGGLFAIETVQEYPGTHDSLLEFTYNEMSENARPELATQIENLDSYDMIFLGYPNWNADLPMPLYTFLEQYDFSGKTIIPFTTHGGSGFSRTISTIQEIQPNANVVEDGLSISRNNVPDAQSTVTEWIAGLDVMN